MRRAVAALAALLAAAACGEGPPAEPSAEAGPDWAVACEGGAVPVEPLGEIELPCLGDEAGTAVGVGDKPLVLVLWATWCEPCRDEAPEVEAFYRAHGDRVDVLGVNVADPREAARWFADDLGLTFPSVADPENTVAPLLGVPALPGTAFVGADGEVAELLVEPGLTEASLTSTAEAAFGLELP